MRINKRLIKKAKLTQEINQLIRELNILQNIKPPKIIFNDSFHVESIEMDKYLYELLEKYITS